MAKAFAKRLFGPRYGAAFRAAIACILVFFALKMTGLQLALSQSVLLGALAAFCGWLTWQDLRTAADDTRGIFLLPFAGRAFPLVWTGMTAAHIVHTKVGIVLAMAAGSTCLEAPDILLAILFSFCAAFFAGAGYATKGTPGCILAAALMVAAGHLLAGFWALLLALAASVALACWLLLHADPYSLMPVAQKKRRAARTFSRSGMFRYAWRFLRSDGAHAANTFGMWAIAALLPGLVGNGSGTAISSICMAVICTNTPAATMLSGDRALWNSLHALPGQKRMFAVPYFLFLLILGAVPESIFLLASMLCGFAVSPASILAAALFAFESAQAGVFLEWTHPIRSWKTRSDLWRHPRRYAVLLFLVGLGLLFATVPGILPWMPAIAAVQFALFAAGRPKLHTQ